jgi:hypothetical protein
MLMSAWIFWRVAQLANIINCQEKEVSTRGEQIYQSKARAHTQTPSKKNIRTFTTDKLK